MEKTGSGKQQRGLLLLTELDRVKELARQLEAELNLHLCNGPCHLLLQEMLEAIDKSISLVKSGHPVVAGESLPSAGRMPKKRKIMPKWTKEVRVNSGEAAGVEFPVDDGCSWRKYGQKDILGAKHPRGYYRCAHRVTQGCPATKQVQRSDGDPLLFHLTYHGEHTCLQSAAEPSRSGQFRNGLKVETEGLELHSRTTDASCDFAAPTTPNRNNCSMSAHSPAAGGDSYSYLPSWDVDLTFPELDLEADFFGWFDYPSDSVN
ncbi:transcription factor WRKY19-like [Curcuma longa]|uniref:transcription factor WRKY19-like n=1 Tax=Curcuma longa TaxID=136217 RepID=UPI003D9E5848